MVTPCWLCLPHPQSADGRETSSAPVKLQRNTIAQQHRLIMTISRSPVLRFSVMIRLKGLWRDVPGWRVRIRTGIAAAWPIRIWKGKQKAKVTGRTIYKVLNRCLQPAVALCPILRFPIRYRLPRHIERGICSTAFERIDVIDDVSGTAAVGLPSRDRRQQDWSKHVFGEAALRAFGNPGEGTEV
jgi:hypothetical protein